MEPRITPTDLAPPRLPVRSPAAPAPHVDAAPAHEAHPERPTAHFDRVVLSEPATHTAVASELGLARKENHTDVLRRDDATAIDADEREQTPQARDAIAPSPRKGQREDGFHDDRGATTDWGERLSATADASQFFQWISSPANLDQQRDLLGKAAQSPQLASTLTGLQARAGESDSGRKALVGFMGSVTRDPDSTSGLAQAEALAASTAAGRAALAQVEHQASCFAPLAAARTRYEAAAIQSPQGLSAIGAVLGRSASNADLATARLERQAVAAQSPPGREALTHLNRAVAASPSMATDVARAEGLAAGTPAGSHALINLTHGLSLDPTAAASRQAVGAAAATTDAGRAARDDLWGRAASNPALAASIFDQEVPRDAAGLRSFLEGIAANPATASSFEGLQRSAAEDPAGRGAVAQMLRSGAADPAVGQALLGVDNAAAQTANGRAALDERLRGVARHADLAPLQLGIVAQATPAAASWLSNARSYAPTAAAFTQVEVAAVQTPQGVSAARSLFGSADPARAAAIEGVHATAASTPSGREALAHLYEAGAASPPLGTALARLESSALHSNEGAHAYADLHQAAAASAPLSNAMLHHEISALASPEGHACAASTIEQASQRPDTATARAQVQNTAAQGRALAEYFTAISHDPGLSAAQLRADALTATTPAGAALLAERNTALAQTPAGAATLIAVQQTALTTEPGRAAFAAYHEQAAHQPALAASNLQVEAAAAHDESGARNLQALHTAVAHDDRLALLCTRSENAALQTPPGRAAAASLLHAEAASPALAAAHAGVERRVAAQAAGGSGEARAALLAHHAELSRPDLAGPSLRCDAALLQTDTGRLQLAARQREIAADPSRSTIETERMSNAGAPALGTWQRAVAPSPDLASRLAQTLANAGNTAEGRQALGRYLQQQTLHPELASTFAQVLDRSQQTAQGRGAVTLLATRIAQDGDVVAQWHDALSTAAGHPEGARAVASFMRGAAAHPQLADAVRQTQVAALETRPGQRAVGGFLEQAAAHRDLAVPTLQIAAGDERLIGAPRLRPSLTALAQAAAGSVEGRELAHAVHDRMGTAVPVLSAEPSPPPQRVQEAARQIADVTAQARSAEGATRLEADWRTAARVPEAARQTIRVLDLAIGSPQGKRDCATLLGQVAASPGLASAFDALRQAAARAPGGADTVGGFVDHVWDDPETAAAWRQLPRTAAPAATAPAIGFMGMTSVAASRLAAHAMPIAPEERIEAAGGIDPSAWAEAPKRLDGPGSAGRDVARVLEAATGPPVSGARPSRRGHDEEDDMRVDAARTVRPHVRAQESAHVHHLEPVQAVSLFDMADAQRRTCSRCGTSFESRAPACPSCNGEQRELLISSMHTIQRSGYIIGRETDAVEVTASARAAMADSGSFASIRKAPQFVQYRDLLQMRSRNVAGYAVVSA